MEAKFAITVGKFEALHKGHMYLINETKKYAQANGLASAVMSFTEPHPIQVLIDPSYKPLLTIREQGLLLEGVVDKWIPYPFDIDFAKMLPEDFCMLLKSRFNCQALVVGENFRFGNNRQGTAQSLRDIGMDVIEIPHFEMDGEKVSTSQIRSYLLEGELKKANNLLGRCFSLVGEVKKGRQLGRTIGFPTANIHPPITKLLPPDGVYASNVKFGDMEKKSITNIGTNPTVSGDGMRKVESHILDFDGDIYDQEIVVELCRFIRAEHKFSGIRELKRQISEDVRAVNSNVKIR